MATIRVTTTNEDGTPRVREFETQGNESINDFLARNNLPLSTSVTVLVFDPGGSQSASVNISGADKSRALDSSFLSDLAGARFPRDGAGPTDIAGGVDAPEGPPTTGLLDENQVDPLEQLPFDFEGRLPGAAFERGLQARTGRTGQPTNILRRILQSEQGPTQSVFQGSAFADLIGGAPLGEVTGRSLEDFTSGTGRVARSNLAADILRRIGGAGGERIESFLGNEAFGDQPQRFLRPETSGQAQSVVDIVRDALRGVVNPLLVGALPDTNTLFNQFGADVGINPTGGQNFISNLRRRLGLERLGL